jgi:hypothetical protein
VRHVLIAHPLSVLYRRQQLSQEVGAEVAVLQQHPPTRLLELRYKPTGVDLLPLAHRYVSTLKFEPFGDTGVGVGDDEWMR